MFGVISVLIPRVGSMSLPIHKLVTYLAGVEAEKQQERTW